jgi:Tfp pilus assembly protein PilO
MPPETIWLQYSIVGILVLAAGIIAAAFYRLWKDLLHWIEQQDVKREKERELQRTWQAEQDRVRDERWQEFLTSMQEEWLKQDGRNSEVLKQLSAKIDLLIVAVNNHDIWARAKGNDR